MLCCPLPYAKPRRYSQHWRTRLPSHSWLLWVHCVNQILLRELYGREKGEEIYPPIFCFPFNETCLSENWRPHISELYFPVLVVAVWKTMPVSNLEVMGKPVRACGWLGPEAKGERPQTFWIAQVLALNVPWAKSGCDCRSVGGPLGGYAMVIVEQGPTTEGMEDMEWRGS